MEILLETSPLVRDLIPNSVFTAIIYLNVTSAFYEKQHTYTMDYGCVCVCIYILNGNTIVLNR